MNVSGQSMSMSGPRATEAGAPGQAGVATAEQQSLELPAAPPAINTRAASTELDHCQCIQHNHQAMCPGECSSSSRSLSSQQVSTIDGGSLFHQQQCAALDGMHKGGTCSQQDQLEVPLLLWPLQVRLAGYAEPMHVHPICVSSPKTW